MGKNNLDQKERQLLARLHRLEGQVRSIERLLGKNDYNQVLTQLQAVISASKSCLGLYAELLLEGDDLAEPEKQQLVARLLNKFS